MWFFACLLVPLQEVRAFEWQDLWLRSDQQAARLLEEGKADQAAELFEDKEWEAVAKYRNRDFDQAAAALETINGAKSLYNKGNALAHAGKLEDAMKSYKEALEIDSNMEDAVHNMGVVQELLQQMQAQEKGEPSDDDPQEGEPAGEMSDENQPSEEQQSDSENKQQQAEPTDENEPAEGEDEQSEESDDGQESAGEDAGGEELIGEEEQALEQILQRVQDNPHRLLQRKFKKLDRDEKRKGKVKEENPW